MDSIREQLLREAEKLHGKIVPTCSQSTLEECFTTENSKVIFWFNDTTGNTKVLVREQPDRKLR
jgi:hypothetical protein